MSKKVRLSIIGLGSRGEWAAVTAAKRQDVEIVALCDRIPAMAEWVRDHHGITGAQVYDNFDTMLAEANCDGVMITTSDSHHAELVLPALAAGKYVFCEKPLEITLNKCRAIIEADDRAGGKVFVGHNLRYAPLYETVKKHVDAGAIGRVLTIQADEFYSNGKTYFRRWNRLRSQGGGLWITKACHDLDLLAWFAGGTPLEVYAADARTQFVPRPEAAKQCRFCKVADTCIDRARSPRESTPLRQINEKNGGIPWDLCLYNSDSDTLDHGAVTIRFDNDVVATYTLNVVTGLEDRRLRISGTEGTIDGHLAGDTISLCRRDNQQVTEYPLEVDRAAEHGGADNWVVESFVRFVQGDSAPRTRPREAALAVCLGLAATRSADTHAVARMSDFDI